MGTMRGNMGAIDAMSATIVGCLTLVKDKCEFLLSTNQFSNVPTERFNEHLASDNAHPQHHPQHHPK